MAPLTPSNVEFGREFGDEGDHVEFKSGVNRKKLQQANVAFSNSDGGVVLVGVDDAGTVIGHSFDDNAQLSAHEAFEEVANPGRYELQGLDVDGTRVGVIGVARREEGFSQTSGGRLLVRRGKHNVALKGEELAAFVMERAHRRFERSSTNTPFEGASAGQLSRLRDAFSWSGDTARLIERLAGLDLVDVSDGDPTPTVAGVL